MYCFDYVIFGYFNVNCGGILKELLVIVLFVIFVCLNFSVLNLKDYFKDEELKIKVVKGEDIFDLGSGYKL